MTPLQEELAQVIVAGVHRRDLADALGVTRKTIDMRLHLMKRHLKVDSYAELVRVLRVTLPHANNTIEQARRAPRSWCDI